MKVFLTLTKLQQTDRVLSNDDKKTLKIQPENSRETGLYRGESHFVNDSTHEQPPKSALLRPTLTSCLNGLQSM